MNSIDIANETLVSENLTYVYVIKYLMVRSDYNNLILLVEHRLVAGYFNSVFFFYFVSVYQWVVEGRLVAGSHQVDVEVSHLGVADVVAVGFEREAQNQHVGLGSHELSVLAGTLDFTRHPNRHLLVHLACRREE